MSEEAIKPISQEIFEECYEIIKELTQFTMQGKLKWQETKQNSGKLVEDCANPTKFLESTHQNHQIRLTIAKNADSELKCTILKKIEISNIFTLEFDSDYVYVNNRNDYYLYVFYIKFIHFNSFCGNSNSRFSIENTLGKNNIKISQRTALLGNSRISEKILAAHEIIRNFDITILDCIQNLNEKAHLSPIREFRKTLQEKGIGANG